MKRLVPLAAFLAAGCAVGPDYERPAPPPSPEAERFVDPGLSKVADAPAEGEWWRLFRDPALDRLVAQALAHNTDLRETSANLRQARAVLSQARTGRFPSTDLSGGYSRQRIGLDQPQAALSGAGNNPDRPDAFEFDFYQVGFDASYEVDVFGRVSRSIEAARADAAAAQARLDAARVSVVAETARTYAQACGFAAQAEVARETARLQGETLALTRRLAEAGRGTAREINQAIVLAENARAQVPLFEGERRAALYALAALTGRPPAEIDADVAACNAPPQVKTLIPVGDGAGLLARRADVREAERRLAAETARIGIATAALFPSVRLAGSASLASTDVDRLGKGSSFNFSLGPLISWSFPNIGVARSRIRQAEASTQAALARFDGTMLTALKEVEQALARYAGVLESRAAYQRSAAAATDAARIAGARFESGRDSFLQRLDAERDRAAARAALARAEADLAEAQVSLFKALGGGWETAPEPQPRTP